MQIQKGGSILGGAVKSGEKPVPDMAGKAMQRLEEEANILLEQNSRFG